MRMILDCHEKLNKMKHDMKGVTLTWLGLAWLGLTIYSSSLPMYNEVWCIAADNSILFDLTSLDLARYDLV